AMQVQPKRNRSAVCRALELLCPGGTQQQVPIGKCHHQTTFWHVASLDLVGLSDRYPLRVTIEELEVSIASYMKKCELQLEVGEVFRQSLDGDGLRILEGL